MTLTNLPPLKPTEYLFEKYADKGNTKAEIFAWAARDIMSRVTGLPKIELSIKDKSLYKNFMTGKVDEIEHSGKKFTAKPMPSMIPCLSKKKKRSPADATAKPAEEAAKNPVEATEVAAPAKATTKPAPVPVANTTEPALAPATNASEPVPAQAEPVKEPIEAPAQAQEAAPVEAPVASTEAVAEPEKSADAKKID